jgi:hypothetical protein
MKVGFFCRECHVEKFDIEIAYRTDAQSESEWYNQNLLPGIVEAHKTVSPGCLETTVGGRFGGIKVLLPAQAVKGFGFAP